MSSNIRSKKHTQDTSELGKKTLLEKYKKKTKKVDIQAAISLMLVALVLHLNKKYI